MDNSQHSHTNRIPNNSTRITEVILNESKNILEIHYRESAINNIIVGGSNSLISGNVNSIISGQLIDKVYKHIYGVSNGKITFIKRVDGKVTPAHYVPEAIEYENIEG